MDLTFGYLYSHFSLKSNNITMFIVISMRHYLTQLKHGMKLKVLT